MRALRYGINVTLDGCVHHEAGLAPDAESMAFWTDEMSRAGALLYGRTTYQMMESAWRRPASGEWPGWMGPEDVPFAEQIDAMPKHVVTSTLESVGWNAELVRGDLEAAVRALKKQPGPELLTGGVTLPGALADLGLIDELTLLVHPVLAGRGPYLLAGLRECVELAPFARHELSSGAVVMRLRPA